MKTISCQIGMNMLIYNSVVKKSRRVGMADEADSKSVVGNHVWVQVPSPAVI